MRKGRLLVGPPFSEPMLVETVPQGARGDVAGGAEVAMTGLEERPVVFTLHARQRMRDRGAREM